jgi:hypothetical protein
LDVIVLIGTIPTFDVASAPSFDVLPILLALLRSALNCCTTASVFGDTSM